MGKILLLKNQLVLFWQTCGIDLWCCHRVPVTRLWTFAKYLNIWLHLLLAGWLLQLSMIWHLVSSKAMMCLYSHFQALFSNSLILWLSGSLVSFSIVVNGLHLMFIDHWLMLVHKIWQRKKIKDLSSSFRPIFRRSSSSPPIVTTKATNFYSWTWNALGTWLELGTLETDFDANYIIL